MTMTLWQYGCNGNELTYDWNDGENSDEDGDGEENENEGIKFVVTFLNQRFSLIDIIYHLQFTIPESMCI